MAGISLESSAAAWYARPSAERSVVSLCLQSMQSFIDVASKVHPQDFLDTNNRAIYTTLCSLSSLGVEVFDLPTVASALNDLGMLESAGGYDYLDALFISNVSSENLSIYVSQMLDASLMYRLEGTLKSSAEFVHSKGNSSEVNAESVLSHVEESILGLGLDTLKISDGNSIGDGVLELLAEYEANPSTVRGLQSGFTILDRILNGFIDGGLYVVAARPKMGKCLTGDTRILNTKTGLLERLDNVAHGEVPSLVRCGISSKEFYGPVSNGVKKVYTIKTRLGRELKVTDNHPLLTPIGWCSLDTGLIKKGTRIASPKILPFFGKDTCDLDKLTLLAYWLSEGTRQGGFISATRSSVLNDICDASERLGFLTKQDNRGVGVLSGDACHQKALSVLGIKEKMDVYMSKCGLNLASLADDIGICRNVLYSAYNGGMISLKSFETVKKYKNNIIGLDETYLEFVSGNLLSSPIDRILNEFNVERTLSFEKRIPNLVFKQCKKHLAHFLNRLYSGDGWITEKEIGYSTSSSKMADDLVHLLLRFGIVAKKRSKSGRYLKEGVYVNTRLNYSVSFNKKEYMLVFLNEIGCVGRPEEIKCLKDSLSHRRVGTVFGNPPKELIRFVVNKLEEEGVMLNELSKLIDYRVRLDRGVSFDILDKIKKKFPFLLKYTSLYEDIFWDEIVSIHYYGNEEVYDIEVLNGEHNFVANDIFVHNSMLLTNWAAHMCRTQNVPILYIDTEMTFKEDYQPRFLSHLSGVPERIIKNGLHKQDEKQHEAVYWAAKLMQDMKFVHKYMPGFRMDDVRSMVRKYHARDGIGALFFDYVKMVELNDNFNETQTLGYITSSLKDLAGTLGIPVITAVQINRTGEGKSRISSDQIADSDRVLRYCNVLMALAPKLAKEVQEDGRECGTHRLQILDNRGGSSFYSGIDLLAKRSIITMEEAPSQSSDSLMEQKKVEEEKAM